MNPSALVVIASFDTVSEAAVVQALLESEGIPVHAGNSGLIGLDWSFSQSLGGVRLQVPAEHAEAAFRLVAAYRRGENALAEDDAGPPAAEACAHCGGADVTRRVPLVQKALLVALTVFPGAMFPTHQNLRTCRACGHQWSTEA
jgi:hypothetical protein